MTAAVLLQAQTQRRFVWRWHLQLSGSGVASTLNDIRTAFVNAPSKLKYGGGEPLEETHEEEETPPPMLLKPPAILVKLGFFTQGQLWGEAPLQQAGSEQVRVPEAPLPQAGSERVRVPEAPRMNSVSQQVREPEETPPKAKAQVKAKAEAKSGEEAPLPKAKAEAEVKTQERKEGQRGSGHASSSTSQSTQHAASTGSSQAKAGTPTQSTPVNDASLNTGGVATPPVVQLSFTGLGQRYHHRNDCYGLRNSRRVIRTDLCPI